MFLKNIVVVGGSGRLGSAIVNALLAAGGFSVAIMSRSGKEAPAENVRVIVVDYDDRLALRDALAGQDALVCALSREAILTQISLIDAAIAAGVKRFIPSEFGANLQNENARRLVTYQHKCQVEHFLESIVKRTPLTYTYIYTNVLIDWSTEAGVIMNLRDRSITLYNGGTRAVSMSTIPGAAKAVVSVLMNHAQTENRAIYAHEIIISQQQLLRHAKAVIGDHGWKETTVDLRNLDSRKDLSIFHVGAMKAAFEEGFGNVFEEANDKILECKPLTDEDLQRLLKNIAGRSI